MKFFVWSLAALSLNAVSSASNPGLEYVKREVALQPYQLSPHPKTDCKYASEEHILDVWNNLYTSDWGGFFKNFHYDIDWTVMYTQPLSGHYTNLTQFIVNGVVRLLTTFDGPANFTLINLVGGCDSPWSVEETLVGGKAKNGRIIDEVVVWATRWDEQGKIVQVRSYVDSFITARTIFENEDWTNSSWRTDRPFYIPGPSGMPNLTAYLGYDPSTLPP